MTEEEAVLRACPFRFVRVQENYEAPSYWGEDGLRTVTRTRWVPGAEIQDGNRCIGSRCMAWGEGGCRIIP
jgi:hypothetical protein